MLGILFIYWVGKSFYELAFEFNKNKWLYGILGVITYYGGIILGGFIIGIVVELLAPGSITEDNETMWGFAAIPIGMLVCWGFYKMLKRNWSKDPELTTNTLDGGLIDDTNKYRNV